MVLLELDLSNPSLGEQFDIRTAHGITDYLTGAAEPEEIIKKTEASANLFLVTAGVDANPLELGPGKRLQHLLIYLEEIFDYIIIDTAPVGLLSEAYALSGLSDMTLYVVRHKHTPKILIQRLDETNKVHELKNIAIVFNGIRPRGFNNRYGAAGYGNIYSEEIKRRKPAVVHQG